MDLAVCQVCVLYCCILCPHQTHLQLWLEHSNALVTLKTNFEMVDWGLEEDETKQKLWL
jgi:hypothetical protein